MKKKCTQIYIHTKIIKYLTLSRYFSCDSKPHAWNVSTLTLFLVHSLLSISWYIRVSHLYKPKTSKNQPHIIVKCTAISRINAIYNKTVLQIRKKVNYNQRRQPEKHGNWVKFDDTCWLLFDFQINELQKEHDDYSESYIICFLQLKISGWSLLKCVCVCVYMRVPFLKIERIVFCSFSCSVCEEIRVQFLSYSCTTIIF